MKIIGKGLRPIVVLAIAFAGPLESKTISERLPSCIEQAEALAFFADIFKKIMEDMGEVADPRELVSMYAIVSSRYLLPEVLAPLLEEKAAHETIMDTISAYETNIFEFEDSAIDFIKELYSERRSFTAKAKFISMCAEGAFEGLN